MKNKFEQQGNEFEMVKKGVESIIGRLGEEDLIASTLNSVFSHMEELSSMRDSAKDPEIKTKLEGAIDTAKFQMENLILQTSGAADQLESAKKIPDEVFKRILDQLAEIEQNLTEAESPSDNIKKAA